MDLRDLRDAQEVAYRTTVEYQKRIFALLGLNGLSNQTEDNHALIDAEVRRLQKRTFVSYLKSASPNVH